MKRLLLLGAVLTATPAQSAPPADLAAIELEVARFTGAQIGEPGGAATSIDRRLRLASCPVPLNLTRYGQNGESVLVQCPAAGGWRLFVPLAAGVPGATATPVIQRGDAVTLTLRGDSFAVSQAAQAQEGGAVGAWIKVRGLGPNAPVQRARVLSPGVVGIDLP